MFLMMMIIIKTIMRVWKWFVLLNDYKILRVFLIPSAEFLGRSVNDIDEFLRVDRSSNIDSTDKQPNDTADRCHTLSNTKLRH